MQINHTNVNNSVFSGYESAKRNAESIGAKLVSYAETEDMAASTVVSKSPKTLSELEEYIQDKYGVNQANKTIEGIPASISVSPAFLQKALDDPEKLQWLEENLEAMQSLNTGLFAGTLTSVSYSVDGEGNITMITSGTSDPDGRIARENAKRKEQERLREEKREKERLEQKKLEEQEQQKRAKQRLEKTGQQSEVESAQGSFRFISSGDSVKTLQLELTNALQSGASLEVRA
ncbi:hypothetical protein [Helicobacter sp. MIT 05-5294]|uniref:hypothetical protein n=1 Tax=Helicobacter sp. MIT 05-5294 TaxID=1548150 RepID=UPI0010FF2CC9|nr:hypothetical protein [Helicobacter sp. MIT 05-5294]TLD85456.1 hypothetical protein LS69_009430 [Helicobacter sp. MIT 05-5294]